MENKMKDVYNEIGIDDDLIRIKIESGGQHREKSGVDLTDPSSNGTTQNREFTIVNSEEFGRVRVIYEDARILFCGNDVAKALGYSNAPDALSRHCRCIVKRDTPHPQSSGKTIDMSFIPEGDIYRLIAHSKLPAADKFEQWVFDEVLPTIRKTGGYVNNDDLFVDTYLPMADENTKNLFRLQLKTIRQLNGIISDQNKTIEDQKPLVEFAEAVSNTKDCIDVGQMAKILRDENIKIGRNRLFDWLRENDYLMKNNTPYQKHIESGLFIVKEIVKNTAYGSKVFTKTYVTGKGQIHITEKLREKHGDVQ